MNKSKDKTAKDAELDKMNDYNTPFTNFSSPKRPAMGGFHRPEIQVLATDDKGADALTQKQIDG